MRRRELRKGRVAGAVAMLALTTGVVITTLCNLEAITMRARVAACCAWAAYTTLTK